MNLIRAFIAIEFPPELKQSIAAHSVRLQKLLGQAVRWVAPNNFHLTLKFLGDISPGGLSELQQALRLETQKYPPFSITLGGLGVFPGVNRPRVIWVGVQMPPVLGRLQQDVDRATTRLGYSGDEKGFSAHLTLGRVREQISPTEQQALRQVLESARIPEIGTLSVHQIHLIRSDLRPGGSVYTPLFAAQLGEPTV